MQRIHVIAAAVAALIGTAAVPAVATARQASDEPKAEFVGKLKRHGDVATLHVRYSCDAADALWVSAKQTADGEKDAALEGWGSSEIAATWWQSHRNEFVCDGTSRTAKFDVDTVEPGSKGTLRKGYAWIQFCLSRGDEDLEIYELGWVPVR